MARVPTTLDAFNAVAEPKRRQLLEALDAQELAVNELVDRLGWPQPMISKHLGVLKKVGLVKERRVGRRRLYRVDARELKPIHDWVSPFERFWQESYDRLDEYLERAKAELPKRDRQAPAGAGTTTRRGNFTRGRRNRDVK